MRKKFGTAQDVVELFADMGLNDIKIERVYGMSREGILPSIRLGRQVRFDLEKIQTWLENGGQSFNGGWRKEAVVN